MDTHLKLPKDLLLPIWNSEYISQGHVASYLATPSDGTGSRSKFLAETS